MTSASPGTARFEPTPFTSSGSFAITNLRATTLWSYLRDALPFELTSGLINLEGGYEFAARESGLKLNVKNVTAARTGAARSRAGSRTT